VIDVDALAAALREAPGEDWIRGVGYHESVAGMLDRGKLDALVADRPVRIQHRSGRMWFINSAAAGRLDLDDSDGQLFRRDDWLRDRTEPVSDEDVLETSRLLASYGVTGITDTTPSNDDETASSIASLGLLQDVHLMGNERLARGHLKIMLDDYALPDIDAFRSRIGDAHRAERPVAIHCVTRTELVFALSTLLEAGTIRGDRIEHASVTDDATMSLVSRAGVTVVTQPNFIFERGDQYLADVEASELDHLYRCRGFLDAGVPLGGGTDAPFGQGDPWLAMRSAVSRRTASGEELGGCEALTPEQALALFASRPDDPGGPTRRVALGESADYCLLDRAWASARESLRARDVAATVAAGVVTFRR
ncbi:MAG: amidohydrolase family protein, partial [Gammaproteobacteria bacterium]